MSHASPTRASGHQHLRRSRAAAMGVSLCAVAALLVPASVAAQSLPETVTVSWLLPVAPQVQLDTEDASPSNFAAIFPQVYVAQVDGASLGSDALLPQCGYVQEDVYLLSSQDDVALLASLEANGLTLSGWQGWRPQHRPGLDVRVRRRLRDVDTLAVRERQPDGQRRADAVGERQPDG